MKYNPTDNKTYKNLLEAEILNVEKRSQKMSGYILAITIVVMNVFIEIDNENGMSEFIKFTHLLSGALIVWFLGTSLLIARGYYHPIFKYLNIILQISTVTFYLLASASLVDADFAISSTAPMFYLLIIALTSLTINPMFSLLAGGFSAGQFIGVYAVWLQDMTHIPGVSSMTGDWIQVTLKAIVFIVMGIVAMLIARSSRNMLERVVTQVSHEENIKFIDEEMTQAAEIQERLIPSSYLNPRCYNIETYYCPARQVGGDYFDVIELPGDRCLVVIADVSGKGYAAALMMSNIQAMVKTLANLSCTIEEMVRLINKSITDNSVRGKFVTIVFMELDPLKNSIKYINCGHNAPMILSKDGIVELDGGGPVLGVVDDVEYEVIDQTFKPGDVLLAYTDGLSELRDKHNKQLGKQNIIAGLKTCDDLTPVDIKQFLLARILEHAEDTELSDDLSFVCVQAYS